MYDCHTPGKGIVNLVVELASIEVNGRRRRAKTDRLDSDKLLSMLIRFHAGEPRVWSVAPVARQQQCSDGGRRQEHRPRLRLDPPGTAPQRRDVVVGVRGLDCSFATRALATSGSKHIRKRFQSGN
jgi:hypothetical protein